MKNLDLTITGPQGSGKSTLTAHVLNDAGFKNARVFIYDKPLYLKLPIDVAAELREEAADVIVFDACFTDRREVAIAAQAVAIYREITKRKVAAVYCVQTSLTDLLNFTF